jgi:hypothetical protein
MSVSLRARLLWFPRLAALRMTGSDSTGVLLR